MKRVSAESLYDVFDCLIQRQDRTFSSKPASGRSVRQSVGKPTTSARDHWRMGRTLQPRAVACWVVVSDTRRLACRPAGGPTRRTEEEAGAGPTKQIPAKSRTAAARNELSKSRIGGFAPEPPGFTALCGIRFIEEPEPAGVDNSNG